MRLLRRAWIPLLVVLVVVIGGFTVARVRTFFGTGPGYLSTENNAGGDTKPFNPKVVKYEIWGDPSASADVSYLDLDAQPVRADGVSLPWSITLSTTDPAVSPNISAQGNGNSLSCRITVDNEVKDEKTTDGVHAFTFCLVKSA